MVKLDENDLRSVSGGTHRGFYGGGYYGRPVFGGGGFAFSSSFAFGGGFGFGGGFAFASYGVSPYYRYRRFY